MQSAKDLREAYRRALNVPDPSSIMTLTGRALNSYLVTGGIGAKYLDDYPDYAGDTEDALKLLPVPNMIMLFRAPDIDNMWHCSLNSVMSNLKYMGEGTGETLALAICRCYLNWKENERRAQVP